MKRLLLIEVGHLAVGALIVLILHLAGLSLLQIAICGAVGVLAPYLLDGLTALSDRLCGVSAQTEDADAGEETE